MLIRTTQDENFDLFSFASVSSESSFQFDCSWFRNLCLRKMKYSNFYTIFNLFFMIFPIKHYGVNSADYKNDTEICSESSVSKLSLSSSNLSPFGFENGIKNEVESGRTFPLLEKPSSPTKILNALFSRRLFNTTMNCIVPGFQLHIPHNTEQGSLVHLTMQAFFGLFWAAAWISTIAVPLALTYFQPLGLGER